MPIYNRAARAARTLVHFLAILWKRKTCNYFIITIMLLTDFLFNVARPLCFLKLPFGFALSTVLLVREITGRVFWPIGNYHPNEYFYTRRIFAFKRTHTIYVVFHSRGFYDVPRVFMWMLGHSMLWPPSWIMCIDPMPDKMNLYYLKLLVVNFKSL